VNGVRAGGGRQDDDQRDGGTGAVRYLSAPAAMARRGDGSRTVVELEYLDRLLGCKLEQATKILVPEQARATAPDPG